MPKAGSTTTHPKFPYTTQPKALRRLLAEIPKRPKPTKITLDTLKAWDVSKANDTSPINVLKKLGILGQTGEPTPLYVDFMKTGGAGVLGERIKETYLVLFQDVHAPQSEGDEALKKLFNIHSGGGTSTSIPGKDGGTPEIQASGALPPIRVDLHIHLPENKTSRDYEAIIQDIAKYIYGRTIDKG